MTNGNGAKAAERLNTNSRTLLEGPDRAVALSYFKAIGMSDNDLAKPIIGIANTWTEIGPCNWHLRRLAAKVREGIKAAGGTPLEFNTVSISDGITMGTEGMKASLVSRELIADSIELIGRANYFDAIIALVGCDKTIPGAIMGLIRLNVPSLVLYGGSIAAGHYKGRDVTVQDMFEAVGAFSKGGSVCPGWAASGLGSEAAGFGPGSGAGVGWGFGPAPAPAAGSFGALVNRRPTALPNSFPAPSSV